jgi:hypothetical protein
MASTGSSEAAPDSEADGLPSSSTPAETPAPTDVDESVAAVADLLADAGVLAQPRALLHGVQDEAPRLSGIQRQMQRAGEIDPAAYSMRTQELAYLANTILAGCSIQARPFTPREASEAAAAVCNLGLENWPARWLPARPGDRRPAGLTILPEDLLVTQDLVSVFQVGWTILHDEVCMAAADRLIGVLNGVRRGDGETQAGIDALRTDMTKQWRSGTPWRARDAMDVIAILDLPAWAGLLGLIDECPVMHASIAATRAGTRTFDASAFTFISENGQLAAVHEFLQSLPEMLRP